MRLDKLLETAVLRIPRVLFEEKGCSTIVILWLTRGDIVIPRDKAKLRYKGILRDKAKLRDIVILRDKAQLRDIVLLRKRGKHIFSDTDRSCDTAITFVDALYLHQFNSLFYQSPYPTKLWNKCIKTGPTVKEKLINHEHKFIYILKLYIIRFYSCGKRSIIVNLLKKIHPNPKYAARGFRKVLYNCWTPTEMLWCVTLLHVPSSSTSRVPALKTHQQ